MRASTVKAVMRAIAAGEMSRWEAARKLGGISERHVNRLMNLHGVKRPPGETRGRRLIAQMRREAKVRAARAAVAGEATLGQAANAAGCSERTLYRWIQRVKNRSETKQKRRKTARNR